MLRGESWTPSRADWPAHVGWRATAPLPLVLQPQGDRTAGANNRNGDCEPQRFLESSMEKQEVHRL